jgi:pimeloyl-ACP methyl ester carboxylesterase
MEERRQFRNRWVGALQNAEVPVRFINGAADPISGRHMADRFRELVNNDVVLLSQIGHYPQTEDPESVLKHYLRFLES